VVLRQVLLPQVLLRQVLNIRWRGRFLKSHVLQTGCSPWPYVRARTFKASRPP